MRVFTHFGSRIGFSAVLGLSLMLGACGGQRTDANALQLELRGIEILQVGFVSEDVVLLINLKNPTASPIPTTGLAASFFLGGVLISQGVSRDQVPIPANGAAQIAVAGPVNMDALLERGLGQMSSRNLEYNVRGNIFTSPFSTGGTGFLLSGDLGAVRGGTRSGEHLTSGLF